MSSNAALAAAKRRRNVSFNESIVKNNTLNTKNAQANTNPEQKNSNSRSLKGPVTPGDLIRNHDQRLFDIENKLDLADDTFVKKVDLKNLALNNDNNDNNNNNNLTFTPNDNNDNNNNNNNNNITNKSRYK